MEVIEHLESPVSFLRNVRGLLKPDGIALITTPNMDNAPSRIRFLLTGKLHMMDEKVPNHISPIFYDLFIRTYLPRAGLYPVGHFLYPPDNYRVSRSQYASVLRILARVLPGHTLGDISCLCASTLDRGNTDVSKRVVLVYPRYVTGWQVQTRLAIPLSVLCVGTPLSLSGYPVRIIDQRVEPDWRSILTEELAQDPICVGVSSMTGPQLQFALDISAIAKRCGNAPIVWGGVHASLLPEQTLQNENIDIVVRGEGEETFLELVQALDGKRPLSAVPGIWYKENGAIKHTGNRPFVDLNQLPPLSYDLINLAKYRRVMFGVPHQNFFTSRGCPCQCTFCYNTAFDRKRWRAMEPDLVVKRIKDFVTEYKVQGLIINESNFFVDMDRARCILKGIVRENLGIVISKVNIDVSTLFKLSRDDFALLERAGCRRVPIAIESGSERIRTLLKKPADERAASRNESASQRHSDRSKLSFYDRVPDRDKT